MLCLKAFSDLFRRLNDLVRICAAQKFIGFNQRFALRRIHDKPFRRGIELYMCWKAGASGANDSHLLNDID